MVQEESEITKFVQGLEIEGEQSITYEERNKLLHFNTDKYWHCYYNPKTKVLYNQYCQIIMNDAYSYLLGIGMIDEKGNQIKYFEE